MVPIRFTALYATVSFAVFCAAFGSAFNASEKYRLACVLSQNWNKAHIRRYFIDAVPKGKQYDYSQPAVQGVQYCNRLFAIEDSINKKYPGDYEKRKQLHLEKEKLVLEAFWSWLDQQKPVRNTRMDKAINYVLNRRDIAETYLEDGRCSFTNNLSENAIHPFAVGRKNWLFSNSIEGVNASSSSLHNG